MLGLFRPTTTLSSGLLWKSPWRMSQTRKANVRKRIKQVDAVIAACAQTGLKSKSLAKAMALPTYELLRPRDKYTTFNRNAKGLRQSLHKIPKFTRKSFRENPEGF